MMFGPDKSASTDGQWFEGQEPLDVDTVAGTGSELVLHAKDLVMIGLGLLMIVLVVTCCGMRSRRGHKYQRVVMDSETEIENLRV